MGLLKRYGWDWELLPTSKKGNLKFITMCDLSLESKIIDLHNRRLMFKILNPHEHKPFPIIVPLKGWNKGIFNGDGFSAELAPSTKVFGEGTYGVVIRLSYPEFLGIVKTEEDIDELKVLYDVEIIKKAKSVEERFDMELDSTNPVEILSEVGVHDTFTKTIPNDIRWNDTDSKKLYPDKTEFKSIPIAKDYLREDNLRQVVPIIADAIRKQKEVMQGYLSREVARDNTLLIQTQLLKNQNELSKKTLEMMNKPFLAKVWDNIKYLCKGIMNVIKHLKLTRKNH
jgi:hypothetical protein